MRVRAKLKPTKVSKQEREKKLINVACIERGKKPNMEKKITSNEMTVRSQIDSLKVGMMQEFSVGMQYSKPLSINIQTSACPEKIVLNNLPDSGLSTISPEKKCALVVNLYESMCRSDISVEKVFVDPVIYDKVFSRMSFGSIFFNTYSRFCVYINNFSESEVARIASISDKRREKINCIGSLEVLTLPQVSERHDRYLCVSETHVRNMSQNEQSVSNKIVEEDSLARSLVAPDSSAPSSVPLQFPVDEKESLQGSGQEGNEFSSQYTEHVVVLPLVILESLVSEEVVSSSMNKYGLDVPSCSKRLCDVHQMSVQDKAVSVNNVEILPEVINSKEVCASMEGIASFQCLMFYMKELDETLLHHPVIPFLIDMDYQSDCHCLSILNFLCFFIASTFLYFVAK